MPKIDRIFTGKLNKDDDPYRLPPNDFIDALNITRDAKGEGQDSVITNINGNAKISYTLPSGTNKCIGKYGDRVRNRLYYFVYNSNGYHSILYYNGITNTIVKLLESITDSDGIDILTFNISYRVLGVNIIYNSDGDLVFFNDGYNQPRVINTGAVYLTNWKSEYLDVAKSPPQMPIKATYENDTDVTVNNLRNSLYQFRYRFVYGNKDKSVWSTESIVPLPFQPSGSLTEDNYHNNSRISLSISTGSPDVKKIELAVSITQDGNTSDWMLVDSFIKDDLSIDDYDIYTYKFYDNGDYVTIDITDTIQLQDYVPQVAQAQELLNGTNLIYGNIREGYNIITPNFSVDAQAFSGSPFFYDYNGTLFFATINGVDSGSQGTIMKIYLYGTGTNTAGEVTTLNNGAAKYTVNVQDNTEANIGTSYTNSSDNPTVADILSNISTNLQGNGFTEVSLVGNILTMSYPTTLTILSSGTQTTGVGYSSPTNFATTHYTYPWESAYSYSIQYFDDKGRTNGALTPINVTLPVDNGGNMTPQLIISHRPPLWAVYYQVLRTTNNTYEKRLDWITNGAYSDQYQNILGVRYAYLEIDNIEQYNLNTTSSKGNVGYEFQAGDRVRIFGRYDATGTAAALTTTYDYEILGQETSFILNGVAKTGRFLKIYYPTADIDTLFKFDGDPNFLAYRVLIYNYNKHIADNLEPFFEFGKCFGIGNSGAINAYHIGLEQTQDSGLGQPAKITVANGDYFYRNRTIPIGQSYDLSYIGINNGFKYASLGVNIATSFTNSLYTIQSCTNEQYNVFPNNPYDSAYSFLLNLSATDSLNVRITATLPITVDGNASTNFDLIAGLDATSYQTLFSTTNISMVSGQPYNLEIDKIVALPPLSKMRIVLNNPSQTINQNLGAFTLKVYIINNVTIGIIENGFSDNYILQNNGNGRPSSIEVNSVQKTYPTLVRFSGTYEQDTSLNQTNRFKYENADEYDASFGAIMRMHIRDRYLKVYQSFKVGNVPVLTQIVQDTAGNPLQAQSDRLINKIQYYQGDYGIGFSPASLAWNNFSDYFVDDVRGVVCRLSQDGITPLSIVYKTNAFFSIYLKYFRTDLNDGYYVPNGNSMVIGEFDPYTNKYIIALEEINRYTESIPHELVFHQDAYTISFAETRDSTEGFESPVSYKPEMMGVLNNSFFSFKNGEIWNHNSGYCNFYGTQYPCYVTLVFNDAIGFKKTFISLMETGTITWVTPEITTSSISYGTTKQQSELIEQDFRTLESTYNASFLRDSNSIGGLLKGSLLKGEYIIIKLQVNEANTANLVALNTVSVKFIESQYNPR